MFCKRRMNFHVGPNLTAELDWSVFVILLVDTQEGGLVSLGLANCGSVALPCVACGES